MAPRGKPKDMKEVEVELKAQLARASELFVDWEGLAQAGSDRDGWFKLRHGNVTEKKLLKMTAKGSNDTDMLHRRTKLRDQLLEMRKDMRQNRDTLKEMSNPTFDSQKLVDGYHQFLQRLQELGVEKRIRTGEGVCPGDSGRQTHLEWVSEVLVKLQSELNMLRATMADAGDTATLVLKVERHSWHIERLTALQRELHRQGDHFAPEQAFELARTHVFKYTEGAYAASEEEFIELFYGDEDYFVQLGFRDGTQEGEVVWEPVAIIEPERPESVLPAPDGAGAALPEGDQRPTCTDPSKHVPAAERKHATAKQDLALTHDESREDAMAAASSKFFKFISKPAAQVSSSAPPASDGRPLPPPVPSDWAAVWCDVQCDYYFWHKPSNHTTWKLPEEARKFSEGVGTPINASFASQTTQAERPVAALRAVELARAAEVIEPEMEPDMGAKANVELVVKAAKTQEVTGGKREACFKSDPVSYVCSRHWRHVLDACGYVNVFHGELVIVHWFDGEPDGWVYGCVPEEPVQWGYLPKAVLAVPRKEPCAKQRGDCCRVMETFQAPTEILGYLTVTVGDVLELLDKTYPPHAWAYGQKLSGTHVELQPNRGWVPADFLCDLPLYERQLVEF